IATVVRAVWQADVEVRGHLAKGEVLFPVNTEDECAGVTGQQGRVAIPLVHVEVDDGDTIHRPSFEQRQGSHRKIIEHAIAGAEIAVRVVRPASKLSRETVAQSLSGRGE